MKTKTIKLTETQLQDLKHVLQQTLYLAQNAGKSPNFMDRVRELLEVVQKQN